MDKCKVLVLLSSYNGERFIKEQIDSILNQVGVNISLLVRDDGSSDRTLELLKQYECLDNVYIIKGRNVGCANSFLELMKVAFNQMDKYDYFAFCDQDDYWMSEKIKRASSKLETMDKQIPCLYFSNLYVVDASLNNPHLLFNNMDVTLSKDHSLIESFCTGCTMVFNKVALELYLNTPIGNLRIHDKRLYHMCLFLGQVYYDDEAFIKYRQHENNVIGANSFRYQRYKSKLKSIKQLHKQHIREEEAKELLYSFGQLLTKKDMESISIVAYYRSNWKYRYKLLFNPEYRLKRKEDNFWSKIRILIGHI